MLFTSGSTCIAACPTSTGSKMYYEPIAKICDIHCDFTTAFTYAEADHTCVKQCATLKYVYTSSDDQPYQCAASCVNFYILNTTLTSTGTGSDQEQCVVNCREQAPTKFIAYDSGANT